MALSKNFEKEMARREKPKCFGKYEATSKEDKKTCGMCWFAHKCKSGKPAKSEPKTDK